jgi:hypothetical protein
MKARFDDRNALNRDSGSGLKGVAQDLVSDASRSVQPPGRTRASKYWRPAVWILGTVAVLLAWPHASARRATRPQSTWDLEITADGDQSATALVFGEGSGVHLISVPGAGADESERRHLPIRPATGDVHVISLGRNGLRVRTNAPPGGPLISASARARSITVVSDANGRGIRTGW